MTDYDFVFFSISLGSEAVILVALVLGRLSVPRFMAASATILPLMLIFGLSARITKINVGAVAIETKVDQARTYAAEIKSLRDQLLSEQAATKISATNLANTSQIVEELANKNLEAGQKLIKLDSQIKQGELALQRLDTASTFLSTLAAAQNDDRQAFDKLRAWSKDDKFAFENEANEAVKAITRVLSDLPLDYAIPWNKNIDPSKFSLDDLTQQYLSLSDDPAHNEPNLRAAYIQYVGKRIDFTRHDRLQFMIDRMKHDPSMKAISYACAEFARLSGVTGSRTSMQLYENWWDNNAASIKD